MSPIILKVIIALHIFHKSIIDLECSYNLR
jgi:hypothetical protein